MIDMSYPPIEGFEDIQIVKSNKGWKITTDKLQTPYLNAYFVKRDDAIEFGKKYIEEREGMPYTTYLKLKAFI